MADALKNFAYSTVATAPSPASSGTSLVVQAGDGSKFPAAPFYAVIWPSASQPTTANAEVVRVTAVSTDTFTITRAQESSSARTVGVGDQIAQVLTAATLAQYLALTGGSLTGALNITSTGSTIEALAINTNGDPNTTPFPAAFHVTNTANDAVFKIETTGTSKAAFAEVFSTTGSFVGFSGWVNNAQIFHIGRNGDTAGLVIYTNGTTKAATFGDDQSLTLAGKFVTAAGTTSIAPINITSGTNLTTAAAGAMEYDGKVIYSTPNASNRGVSPSVHYMALTADFTGTNVNTAQKIFNGSTNGAITLPGATSYEMEMVAHIHTTGTTSHTIGISFGGTATLTSIGYQVTVTNAATEVLGSSQTLWVTVATNTVLTTATATATHHSIMVKGVVRVNAGGTFIPQYQWSAAPGVAGVTLANSYIKLTPIGSNTVASVGNWS